MSMSVLQVTTPDYKCTLFCTKTGRLPCWGKAEEHETSGVESAAERGKGARRVLPCGPTRE